MTKNKRIPFIFLAGLVGSESWMRESSGGGLAAGTAGSPWSSLLWSGSGMLCVEALSGRAGECWGDFCCLVSFLFLFSLRDWLVGCGGWPSRGERGGEGMPFKGQLGLGLFFHYHARGGRLTTGVSCNT